MDVHRVASTGPIRHPCSGSAREAARESSLLLAVLTALVAASGCGVVGKGERPAGPVSEMLTSDEVRGGSSARRDGRDPLAVVPDGALFAFNATQRIFVNGGEGAWSSVDAKPYAGSGSFGVLTGRRLGDGALLGTTSGLVWIGAADGAQHGFSGLSTTSQVVSIAVLDEESAAIGVRNAGASDPPPVYRCRLSGFACELSNAGMTAGAAFSTAYELLAIGAAGPVFAATTSGVFRSADRAATWAPAQNGLPPVVRVNRIRESQGALVIVTGNGAYRSDDLGGSWQSANDGLPGATYLGALGGAGNELYTSANAAVYRSTDAGRSWSQRAARVGSSGGVNAFAADSRTVYASTSAGIYRSTDGGASWDSFRRGLNTAAITAILPGDGVVYAATAGNENGVFRTTDGGVTWRPGSAVLDTVSVTSLASIGSNVLAGAGPSGLFRSSDGGVTFASSPATGIPATDLIRSLASVGTTFLAGVSQGGVSRSTDGGLTWTPSRAGLPAGLVSGNVLAAHGNTVALGGLNFVYRSVDGGVSWTRGGTIPFPGSYFVYALSFAPSGTLYAALVAQDFQTGGVVRSGDGGASWTRIDSGLPDGPVFSVAAVSASGAAIAPLAGSDVVFAGTVAGVWATVDGGARWTLFVNEAGATPVFSLGAADGTLYAGTTGLSIVTAPIPLRATRLVPVVLDVATATARYTTELALTNRGTSEARLTLRYTASLSDGTGTAHDVLAAGSQLVIPDVIGYLRAKGVPIPESGARAGTLLVTFDGISSPDVVAATARTGSATTAPQPAGRSGLAYVALDPDSDGERGALTVYGLRSDATDRSNLAVFSVGGEPVTVRVTAVSGTGDGRRVVVAPARELAPYEWTQFNGILADAGMANGYVLVERVAGTGAFSAYGVVNDNATNDGSYILPTLKRAGLDYLNVPVLVETPSFRSELVLANSGATPAKLTLAYVETLNVSGGAGGATTLTLAPGEQRILAEAIDALRHAGLAIGPSGASYAGSLHVRVEGAFVNDVFAGARTASRSPAGGQFGVFTPAFTPGSEAVTAAFLYGLRADDTNRSNVAAVNTGIASGPVTLELQAYDGDAGGAPRGGPLSVTLAPGQWAQVGGFLGDQGVRNGWVKVTRVAGTAPWIAYGVVNDGGAPGQRTGDGAYVPMVR